MAQCEPAHGLGGEPAKNETWSEKVAARAVAWTGSTLAFMLAAATIIVWAATGPIFHYSDTWQLVINTSTTIVTFLMVFLLQRAQNKDSHAIHLKLDELVAATSGASNRLIAAEALTEKDMQLLTKHYKRLVELSQKDEDLRQSHSVEEAAHREARKVKTRRRTSKGTKR